MDNLANLVFCSKSILDDYISLYLYNLINGCWYESVKPLMQPQWLSCHESNVPEELKEKVKLILEKIKDL